MDSSIILIMEVRAKLQGKPKKGVSLVLAVSLTSAKKLSTLLHGRASALMPVYIAENAHLPPIP